VNKLYDYGRNLFARGEIHWRAGGDIVKCTLLDAEHYTFDQELHQFMNLDTVETAARVSETTLTLLDPLEGACGAADAVFHAVEGAASEMLVLWKDGGGHGATQSGTTDPLIAFMDIATGLPVTPDGGDILVSWDVLPTRIFKL
jgi:hypothetical protein